MLLLSEGILHEGSISRHGFLNCFMRERRQLFDSNEGNVLHIQEKYVSFEFFSSGKDIPVELSTNKENLLDFGRVNSIRVDRLELCPFLDCRKQLGSLYKQESTGLYLRIFLELKQKRGFL